MYYTYIWNSIKKDNTFTNFCLKFKPPFYLVNLDKFKYIFGYLKSIEFFIERIEIFFRTMCIWLSHIIDFLNTIQKCFFFFFFLKRRKNNSKFFDFKKKENGEGKKDNFERKRMKMGKKKKRKMVEKKEEKKEKKWKSRGKKKICFLLVICIFNHGNIPLEEIWQDMDLSIIHSPWVKKLNML